MSDRALVLLTLWMMVINGQIFWLNYRLRKLEQR